MAKPKRGIPVFSKLNVLMKIIEEMQHSNKYVLQFLGFKSGTIPFYSEFYHTCHGKVLMWMLDFVEDFLGGIRLH